MQIPTRISRKDTSGDTATKIPKNLIQTFRTTELHPFIYNNIQNILSQNPDYNYIFLTDADGEQLIREHFDEKVVSAFLKLKMGAAKADFIRYAAMYIYGGVYLDLDSSIAVRMSDFLPKDREFVFFYDFNKNILQWCFMCAPKNKIIENIIHEMVSRIHNGEKNIFIATGPTLFTDVVLSMIVSNRLYNTYFTMPPQQREGCFIENRNFMNGLFLDEMHYKSMFIERKQGYDNAMLYDDNNPKYQLIFVNETPGLYVTKQ